MKKILILVLLVSLIFLSCTRIIEVVDSKDSYQQEVANCPVCGNVISRIYTIQVIREDGSKTIGMSTYCRSCKSHFSYYEAETAEEALNIWNLNPEYFELRNRNWDSSHTGLSPTRENIKIQNATKTMTFEVHEINSETPKEIRPCPLCKESINYMELRQSLIITPQNIKKTTIDIEVSLYCKKCGASFYYKTSDSGFEALQVWERTPWKYEEKLKE
jgi:uncharacterized protein with PIN domain